MKTRLLTIALAALTVGLLGSCSKINERIDGIDQRVGNIENEKIASIENQIASINAAIADLGTIRKDILDLQVAVGDKAVEISELRAADEALGKRIDELKAYVGDLSKYAEKDWASATFATLEQLNATDTELGELKEKVDRLGEAFDGKLSELNTKLTNSINTAISGVKASICALESRVSALEQMIQSVTIVPAYCDGSVESTKDGVLHLDIIVTPAEAVATLTKDSLKVLVNEVKTKAVDVDTVTVTKFKVDAAKGTITARADISSNLPVASGKALTIALYVTNGISSYITEFYPVSLYSNVTVTEETDTTKISIKTDEDFPEPVAGNILVADGFKDSKPTSIEVSGIGTVIFDETATAKIKANAEQAGATSVFFKVEDVTTTKPVENADVVLEVTMKAVDETGTEVFCYGKAEGEVTIEIPVGEDVYCVKNVTLVDENNNPIQGGVVPDSEKIENGKLIFKVKHFSKYAIDYVTTAEYKAVTGVRIEQASVTLPVDDTLRLAAVIDPEDATNKKVTWSSSDTTKVKVDATGKITTVAFGQATITVTTVDGNKTADCTVKVSETKTMADILNTATGIPESQDLTPPANAWVNSTNTGCKAFVGIDTERDKLFVILKEGSGLAPLGICMDDDFEKIDDNTYQRVEPSVGTFTIKMTEGKFTSYEFTAASGSAYEQFNGTYSAPVSKYVEIKAKYDGNTVTTLRWYKQNLAITASGEKAWNGGSGSAVKVPGTDEDVVVGDYFQWGTFTGFYGNGAGTDKGLLPYTSFTSTGCGDGSNAFTFKSGKKFNQTNAPYWSGSAYTKYNATDNKTELDASDDVASIILGDTWRMPTADEFQAMTAVTYWAWDETDTGYYVYTPNPASDAGKVNDGTGTYDKADALLFFPTAGNGHGETYYHVKSIADYWYGSLNSADVGYACHLYFNYHENGFNPDSKESERFRGFSVRPVQDPKATYKAVTSVSLNETSKNITLRGNLQLKATVIPDDATQQGVYWESSDETVATVDAYGNVKGVSEGTANITATTVDGSKTATCTVTVIPFVDLGVKTSAGKPLYWAECNLGASKPEDLGDYYMWGATALMYTAVDYSKTDGAFTFVTKNPYGDNYKNTWNASLGFDVNNVPFADGVFKNNEGERNVFTKYTTIDTYAKSGSADGFTTLRSDDDAATAKTSSWRMPTIDDFKSLVANCVLVWTSDYNSTGNAGYIVYKAKDTDDKGKVNMNGTWKKWNGSGYSDDSAATGTYSVYDIHIFLPAAGYGNDTKLVSKNTAGAYCSSDLNNTYNQYVGAVNFTKSAFNIAYNYSRSYGFSIRPVTEE